MVNVIKIRRRDVGGAPGPTVGLYEGELAYNFADDVLYIGYGTGGVGGIASSILGIAGKGSFMDISTDQTIGGQKTFSNTITASISGNAATANRWTASRTLSWTGGDVTGTMTVDGSANVAQALTLGDGKVLVQHLGDGAVTNAKLGTMAADRFKGRITVGTGAVEDLTPAQARTILNVADGSMPGTVTSIDLSMPNIFAVANGPIGVSGTLAVTLANQSINTIWAGPSSGGSGAPGFRALVAADIPTITSGKISDFDTQVRTSRLDQMVAPNANVDWNGQRLVGLADPVGAQDASTKAYVDAMLQGLSIKASVRMATTTNVTLSGLQTLDGIVGDADDGVLVRAQTDPIENGIYDMKTGAWVRRSDFDTSLKARPGSFVFVEEGTLYADTGWVVIADTVVLGTTNINWTQFSGAGSWTAGNGLTQTGTTMNIGGTVGRISVGSDSVDIDANYLGQTSINTLGTIGTGLWRGTIVEMAYGGTGVNLTALSNGSLLKKTAGGVVAAVDGTDYHSSTSAIDGGTY